MSLLTRKRHRRTVLCLILTGLIAGCSNAGSTSEPKRSTPSDPHAALTIGLTYLDNSAAGSSLGVDDGKSVNAKTAEQALVRGINTAGGLAGRKLTVVEYAFHTQDNSYSTAASAACALFTQDNHVDVVLDNAFGTTGGFRDCLQKAKVFDITTQSEGDQQRSSQATLHANPLGMTFERSYRAVLDNLGTSGYLTAKNQIGVIVEDCPESSTAYSQSLVPAIEKQGLKPPVKAQFDCTAGFASAGATAAALNNAVLTFRRAKVDRVMFVSSYESIALYLFATAANSQRYTPGYLLTSNAQAALHAALPAGQQAQIHGVGHSPISDVDDAPPSPTDTQCLDLAKSGGSSAATASDRSIVIYACSPALLLEAALKATKGDSSPTALAAAITGLGNSFQGPGLADSRTRFSSTKLDGPDMVQIFGYAGDCSCVRYTGTPVQAPS
jgi:hypothetical protein